VINPPSETVEQQKFVQWLRVKKILHFAPMNENSGSFTNRAVAIRVEAKAKSMGKSNGIPDLFIPVANKYYHGLFIELKKQIKTLKSGKRSISLPKTSPDQEKWIEELKEQGYHAMVCYGSSEAMDVVEDYMKNNKECCTQ